MELEVQPLVYTPDELDRMLARGNDFICTALAEGVVVYDAQHGSEQRVPWRRRVAVRPGTSLAIASRP